MKDKKWLIPDIIDPVPKVCVQLEIPNDIKHIAAFWGALEQLGKAYNWEDSFADGSAAAYVWQSVLDEASAAVKIGENCMVDCGDIEGCLETSTIINVIEGDVITNETNITNNTTEITECQENPPDGNVYPDAPDQETEPDPACGAAYFIVSELRDFIVDLEASDVTYIDLFDALAGWFVSPLAFTVPVLIDALVSIFAGAPSVLTDYDAQLDDMREELYCEGFDKETFSTFIRTLTSGDAIADYLDCVGLSVWQQWYTIGSADLSQDCSSFPCRIGPVILSPCVGGGSAGTLVFLGGISWRATSTLRTGPGNDAVTIGTTDNSCFHLSNVTTTQGNPGWYGRKECDDFCKAQAAHPGFVTDYKEFVWTDRDLPFTVDFDYVAVP